MADLGYGVIDDPGISFGRGSSPEFGPSQAKSTLCRFIHDGAGMTPVLSLRCRWCPDGALASTIHSKVRVVRGQSMPPSVRGPEERRRPARRRAATFPRAQGRGILSWLCSLNLQYRNRSFARPSLTQPAARRAAFRTAPAKSRLARSPSPPNSRDPQSRFAPARTAPTKPRAAPHR